MSFQFIITITKVVVKMSFLSRLFRCNKKTSKTALSPTSTNVSSEKCVAQTQVQTTQATKLQSEPEFDFYANKDPILHIKHLKEVFPIYHRLAEGRWPFLATNGVVNLLSIAISTLPSILSSD